MISEWYNLNEYIVGSGKFDGFQSTLGLQLGLFCDSLTLLPWVYSNFGSCNELIQIQIQNQVCVFTVCS